MTAEAISEVEHQLAGKLAEGAYLLTVGRKLAMEVRDLTTDLVWATTEPVTQEYFDNLQLEEGLVKVWTALPSVDRAAFQCSPGRGKGREAEPVLQRIIDGRTYINVARPIKQLASEQPGGPIEIQVEKTHLIGFKAGRSVAVLKLPEGNFVELVGDASRDESLVLPPGGELTSIELTKPWVLTLPNPTRTFFWFKDVLRSFQGPVQLP